MYEPDVIAQIPLWESLAENFSQFCASKRPVGSFPEEFSMKDFSFTEIPDLQE